MTLIVWSDSLAVGVADIDSQHQKLVQLINGLHDHMLKGDAHDIMQKVLDRVIQYTVMHFQMEEGLMAKYGYPHSPTHKREHADLTRHAIELQQKLMSGNARITMETMTFLRDWLQNHILKTDKLLGAHLQSKGVH
jgi:hemerythrin-like metal-binding protein